MPNSKQIVYLSQAQYAELIANGSITVDGVTVNYDENDIYLTPQAEPVTDVRVAGTSVAANGVADIPYATDTSHAGVVKAPSAAQRLTQGTGVHVQNDGVLSVTQANSSNIKGGYSSSMVIVPSNQHEATFYGLAKVAGHNENNSTEPLGTYTPEAKGAIQSMLGVSDLIATFENNLVASKAYAIGDVFTANGKLYKATAVIAADAAIITDGANANCEETSVGEGFPHDVQIDGTSVLSNGVANLPIAGSNTLGVARGYNNKGINIDSSGNVSLAVADSIKIKAAASVGSAIPPGWQHISTFYGLAKAAGADMANLSDITVGQYPDEQKIAIQKMLGIYEAPWELIREDTFTNAEEADHIITVDENGEAFELTNVRLLFELPKVDAVASKGYYGQIWFYYDESKRIVAEPGGFSRTTATDYAIGCWYFVDYENKMVKTSFSSGTSNTNATPMKVRYFTYDAGAEANEQMGMKIFADFSIKKINIKSVTGTGHYKLFGRRKWN